MYIYVLLFIINIYLYKRILELINILDYKIENDLVVKIQNPQKNNKISTSDDILLKKRSHTKPSSGSLFYADKVIKQHSAKSLLE
jgi:hypothetical protein